MLSEKILFFLITSSFLQYTSQRKQIRGTPEVDYPTYYVIPKTSFRCSDQLFNPGFYADIETRCQVFHYCYEHRQESFLCPMGTIFNQPILACDYWYSSNCSLAPSYYHVNADKINEDQFDAAEDSLNLPPENLFDKMAYLYEINKVPESPSSVKNASDAAENELDKDGVETSDELPINNNKTEDYDKYSYDNQYNMVDEEHPEVVKYEVSGINTLNIHKGSENDQIYEADSVKDFIFSEDGMLHQRQEDTYQMYPTDMNFNQEYSGYAEIASEGNVNYDLNEFDPKGDFQISDFALEKRYADMTGDYVRKRPSNRKPIIVIPEEEPEIVRLPVVKHKRKPIVIGSTVTKHDDKSSYEPNYDSNVYIEDTDSIANEVIESTTSDEFPLNGANSDQNDYDLSDPRLNYEIQEEIIDENGSQQHQTDNLNVISDYSDREKTRNMYVVSNNEEAEISSDVFGLGNDFLSVSNVEHQSTFSDSNYGDELKSFIGHNEGFTVLPDRILETTSGDESSFDSDSFLGSGSEVINRSHSSDGSSFPENQDIFSDSEDELTDIEASNLLPMNLSDTFEGSGISLQEAAGMSNFNEVNEPNQFVLNEDGMMYAKEISFSSEPSENFSSLKNSEDEELELVPEGSGGSNELDYLPHELQESSAYLKDASGKTVPEIREIDGNYYYVYSDSEYHSNDEYEDSSEFISESIDYASTENLDDTFDKKTDDNAGNEEFRYSLTDSKLKMDNTDGSQEYKGTTLLENTYDKLSDELEMETSPDMPEEYVVDNSDNRELSTEDLKYLEIMSENPSTMVKNSFEVSYEKSSSHATKEEMSRIEIASPDHNTNEQAEIFEDPGEQSTNEQAEIFEDPGRMEEGYKFESLASDTSSDIEKHPSDVGSSEILDAEQVAEEVSNITGSGEDGSDNFSLEKNLEAFVPRKEADPFNPLFAEGDKMLDGPGKQKLSSKIPPVQSNILANPVIGKDIKKASRGRKFTENVQTYNPPNKGEFMMVPSRDTFRETMFTNIPSTFLKMKHSSLRPYFYNHDSKNYGYNPRTGDLLQSSKLSKLTSLGKRLLAAKSAKFNSMKRYIDSYRN